MKIIKIIKMIISHDKINKMPIMNSKNNTQKASQVIT